MTYVILTKREPICKYVPSVIVFYDSSALINVGSGDSMVMARNIRDDVWSNTRVSVLLSLLERG